jgi:peptidoglycan/LPS O-acetylase OafA/YrhL
MSAPNTEQRRDARGLLGKMFVGPSPSKPPGRVRVTIVLVAFVVWCSATALSWGGTPTLLTLAIFCGMLAAVLSMLGSLASYHRWKGERPGWLLRLASGMLSGGFLILLLAHMVLMGLQTGQWGWLWWAAVVLGLTSVVIVAGYYYGPDDPSESDGNPSARHGPGN